VATPARATGSARVAEGRVAEGRARRAAGAERRTAAAAAAREQPLLAGGGAVDRAARPVGALVVGCGVPRVGRRGERAMA
jgi:hypothetical protein